MAIQIRIWHSTSMIIWSVVSVNRSVMICSWWVMGRRITIGCITRWFCTSTHFFGHCFGHVFDYLHWYFIAHLFRNWSANFFRNFSRCIYGIFDTNCLGKIFTGFTGYENGKILAFFLWNFFAFGPWNLLLNLDGYLEKRKIIIIKLDKYFFMIMTSIMFHDHQQTDCRQWHSNRYFDGKPIHVLYTS